MKVTKTELTAWAVLQTKGDRIPQKGPQAMKSPEQDTTAEMAQWYNSQ